MTYDDYQEQIRRPKPVRVSLMGFLLYGWWFYPLRSWVRYIRGPQW